MSDQSDPPSPLPLRTILVVDDEPANIRILGETLRNQYRLIVATNGAQALDRVRSSPRPDLILLDVQMPDMNGYEVCEQLKSNEAFRKIPIIFITAMNTAQDETRGLEIGAADYITKPFQPAIVLARVRTQMELLLHNEHLEELVEQRTRWLQETQKDLVERLAQTAEAALELESIVDRMAAMCQDCDQADTRALRTELDHVIRQVFQSVGVVAPGKSTDE